MVWTAPDVHNYVSKVEGNLNTPYEKKLKGFSFAKLFNETKDYTAAICHIETYLSVRETDFRAYNFLGQLKEKVHEKKDALVAYKRSLELNSGQKDILIKVVNLYCDVPEDHGRALFWADKAANVIPGHSCVFKLKWILLWNDPQRNHRLLEDLVADELVRHPRNSSLHIKLINLYLDSNSFEDALAHCLSVFNAKAFISVSEWLNCSVKVFDVILKEKHSESITSKVFLPYMVTLNRLVEISLKHDDCKASAFALARFDEMLHVTSKEENIKKEVINELCSQYYLQMATFFSKMSAEHCLSASKATSLQIACLVVSLQHAPSHQHLSHVDTLLESMACLRLSVEGHLLLSHHDSYGTEWMKNTISNICSKAGWKEMTNVLQQSSGSMPWKYHSGDTKYKDVEFKALSALDVAAFDQAAVLIHFQNLHYLIWLGCHWSHRDKYLMGVDVVSSNVFSGLPMDVVNISHCQSSALCRRDIEAFLYCVIRTCNSPFKQGEAKSLLPFHIYMSTTNEMQIQFWGAVTSLYTACVRNQSVPKLKATVQKGLETIRALGNHRIDARLLVYLANTFWQQASQIQGNQERPWDKQDNWESMQRRGYHYLKEALNILEKWQRDLSVPLPAAETLFPHFTKPLLDEDREALLNDTRMALGKAACRGEEFEMALKYFSDVVRPEAAYYEGQIYKLLAVMSPVDNSAKAHDHFYYLRRARDRLKICLERCHGQGSRHAVIENLEIVNKAIQSRRGLHKTDCELPGTLEELDEESDDECGYFEDDTYNEDETTEHVTNLTLENSILHEQLADKDKHLSDLTRKVNDMEAQLAELKLPKSSAVRPIAPSVIRPQPKDVLPPLRTDTIEIPPMLPLAVQELSGRGTPTIDREMSWDNFSPAPMFDKSYFAGLSDRVRRISEEPSKEDLAAKDEVDHSLLDNINIQPLVSLSRIAKVTGEEEETVVFANHAKLYRFDKTWKERGVGVLKILQHNTKGGYRLLMRRDQVLSVCVNHSITPELKLQSKQGTNNAWLWSTAADFSDGTIQPMQALVKFKEREASDLFHKTFCDILAKITSAPQPSLVQTTQQAGSSCSSSASKQSDVIKQADLTQANRNAQEFKPAFVFPTVTANTLPPSDSGITLNNSKNQVVASTKAAFPAFDMSQFPSGNPFAMSSVTFPQSSTKQDFDVPTWTTEEYDDDSYYYYDNDYNEDDYYYYDENELVNSEEAANYDYEDRADAENVSIVYDRNASFIQKAKASRLLLPSQFYNYESLMACRGCRGCANHKTTTPVIKPGFFKVELTFSGSDKIQPANEQQQEGNTSFEAVSHFEPLVTLEQVQVKTGEEEEYELFSEHAKLYRFDSSTKEWKDRGVGQMKLLNNKTTNSSRVLMRRDVIHKICANHTISLEIKLLPFNGNLKAFAWTAYADCSDGEATTEKFAVKFRSVEIAEQFKRNFDICQSEITTNNFLSTDTTKVEDQNNPTFSFGSKQVPSVSPQLNFGSPSSVARTQETAPTFSFGSRETPLTKPQFSFGTQSSIRGPDSTKEATPSSTSSITLSTEESATKSKSASSPLWPGQDGWECSTCMIKNTISQNNCVACSTLKPGSIKEPAASSDSNVTSNTVPQFGFGFHKSNSNSQEMLPTSTHTFSFGSKLIPSVSPQLNFGSPISVANTQETAPTFSFGSRETPLTKPQFSFGTQSSIQGTDSTKEAMPLSTSSITLSTEESATKSKSASSPLWPGQDGWECSTCMIKNTMSQNSCVACSTLKPESINEIAASSDSNVTSNTVPQFDFGFKKPNSNSQEVLPISTQTFSFGSKQVLSASPQLNFGSPNTVACTQETISSIEHQQEGNASFEAVSHFEPLVTLEQVQVKTGEEEEYELFSEHAKLYRFDSSTKEWKDRGVGQMKLLNNKTTNSSRVLMRRDVIHKICANHTISLEIKLLPFNGNLKAFAWTAYADCSDGEATTEKFAVKFRSVEIAEQFKRNFDICQSEITTNNFLSTDITKVEDQNNPTFSFGSKQVPSVSPQLNFGSPSSVARTQETAPTFSFGSRETPLTKPQFSFGTQSSIQGPDSTKEATPSSTSSITLSTEESATKSKSASSPLWPGQDGWECSTCMIKNTMSQNSCVACSTLKPGSIKEPAASSDSNVTSNTVSQFGFGFHKSNSNSQEMLPTSTHTFSFGSKLIPSVSPQLNFGSPISVANTQETAPTFSFGSRETPLTKPQFSFGTQSSIQGTDSTKEAMPLSTSSITLSTEESATKSKSASSPLWPGQDGWECSTCMIKNTMSQNSCVACSTLKPESINEIAASSDSNVTSNTVPQFDFGFKKPNSNSQEVLPISTQTFSFGSKQVLSASPQLNFGSPNTVACTQETISSIEHQQEGNASFEAVSHFEPLVTLEQVQVKTGEEEEYELFSEHAKLYRFDSSTKEWKDRGVGQMKLLNNKTTNSSRVLMRRDVIHKICANHTISLEIKLLPFNGNLKAFAWTAYADCSDGEATTEKFAVKFRSVEIAEQFKRNFDICQSEITTNNFLSTDITKVEDQNNPTFSFGSKQVPSVSPQLNFGSPSSVARTQETAPTFSFGSRETPLTKPQFSFGTQSSIQGPDSTKEATPSSTSSITLSTEESATKSKSASSPLWPGQDGWECSTCMIKNTMSQNSCVACSTLKPGSIKEPAASSDSNVTSNTVSQFGFGFHKSNSNSQEMLPTSTHTFSFGSKLIPSVSPQLNLGSPISVANTQETAPTFSFGSRETPLTKPQFSFGTQSSIQGPDSTKEATPSSTSSITLSTEESATKSKNASSPLWPGQDGWECSQCMIKNTMSQNSCVACSTLKPGSISETAASSDSNFTSNTVPQFDFGFKKPNSNSQEVLPTSTQTFSFGSKQVLSASPQLNFGSPNTVACTQETISSIEHQQEGNASFEAVSHFEPLVTLEQVQVKTGEEEEYELFSEHAKLYRFDSSAKEWKDRGVGQMKLLNNKTTNSSRVLMRRDVIHKICANHTISLEIKLLPFNGNLKAFAWTAYADCSDGEATTEKFAVKFRSVEIAEQFKRNFDICQSEITTNNFLSTDITKVEDQNNPTFSFGSKQVPSVSPQLNFGSPSSVARTQETAPTFSFGSRETPLTKPQFSFGTQSSIQGPDSTKKATPLSTSSISLSTEESAMKSKSASSPLWPGQDGWECSKCMIKNTMSLNSCVACSTLKPGSIKEPAASSDSNGTSNTVNSSTAPQFNFGFQKPNSNSQESATLGSAQASYSSVVKGSHDALDKVNVDTSNANTPFVGFAFGQTDNFNFNFSLTPNKSHISDELKSKKPQMPLTPILPSTVSRTKHSTSASSSPTKEDDTSFEFAPIVQLQALNTSTSEEVVDGLFKERCRLYRFDDDAHTWKERGQGVLTIWYDASLNQFRLMMRRDQVLKLCANHVITDDLSLMPMKGSSKSYIWKTPADLTDGAPTEEMFAAKFSSSDVASQFRDAFTSCSNNQSEFADKDDNATITYCYSPSEDEKELIEKYLLPLAFYNQTSHVGTRSKGTPTTMTGVTASDNQRQHTAASTTHQQYFQSKADAMTFEEMAKNSAVAFSSNAQKTTFQGIGSQLFSSSNESRSVEEEEEECQAGFTPIVKLEQVHVKSGEEDDTVLYSGKAKLYRFVDNTWKERGNGTVKILASHTTKQTRLLMRRDVIEKVCAHHIITPSIELKPGKMSAKTWLWHTPCDFTDGVAKPETFLIRFKDQDSFDRFEAQFVLAQAYFDDDPTTIHESVSPQKEKTDVIIETKSTWQPSAHWALIQTNRSSNDDNSSPLVTDSSTMTETFETDADVKITFTKSPPTSEQQKAQSLLLSPSFYNKNESSNRDNDCVVIYHCGGPSQLLKDQAERLLLPSHFYCPSTRIPVTKYSKKKNGTFNDTPVQTGGDSVSLSFLTNEDTLTFTSLSNQKQIAFSNQHSSQFAGQGAPLFGRSSDSDCHPSEDVIAIDSQDAIVNLSLAAHLETGEENEITLFEARTKLYRFDTTARQWKERGVGILKVLHDQSNGSCRILMRRDQVLKVCVNHLITSSTELKVKEGSDKTILWMALGDISDGEQSDVQLAARFKSHDVANEFLDSVNLAKEKRTIDQPSATVNTTHPLWKIMDTNSDNWECTICCVSNSISLLKCLACSHSREAAAGEERRSSLMKLFGETSSSPGGSISFATLALQSTDNQSPFSGADGGAFKGSGTVLFSKHEQSSDAVDAVDEPQFDPLVSLCLIETSESDEDHGKVCFCERAKLYRFDADNKQWKERGRGELKLIHNSAANTARLLMRRDQVYKLAANHWLTDGMKARPFALGDRTVSWATPADYSEGLSEACCLAARFKTDAMVENFVQMFDELSNPLSMELPVQAASISCCPEVTQALTDLQRSEAKL